jgi:hypothetical protein
MGDAPAGYRQDAYGHYRCERCDHLMVMHESYLGPHRRCRACHRACAQPEGVRHVVTVK